MSNMKNIVDLFSLEGKVAVVVGASSGLGADAARAYAQAGADVAVLARRTDRLEELARSINEETGKDILPVACDVSSEESVKAAVDAVLAHFGTIDILLNNAGINILGDVVNLPTEDWDKVMNTNLRGQFLMCKYVLPTMVEKKYGKIVNIASVNAVMVDKQDWIQRPAYNASKAGVVGLTKAMAGQYAKYGITVNAVGPGLFPTEMTEHLLTVKPYMDMFMETTPSSRHAEDGELNGAVLYFSSDASSYCQGQLIIVDGGHQLV